MSKLGLDRPVNGAVNDQGSLFADISFTDNECQNDFAVLMYKYIILQQGHQLAGKNYMKPVNYRMPILKKILSQAVVVLAFDPSTWEAEAGRSLVSSDQPGLQAEECAADSDLSFLIPVAVGVALGFLIIAVFISYMIGRRKSRTGYQSV
ncbi:lysosome-associated membrane glycoprotein 1 precursor [Cricetulus griseus]|nr:lysosome-associated membrane glycoprotein 1 precursor [Cricetulus griseus]